MRCAEVSSTLRPTQTEHANSSSPGLSFHSFRLLPGEVEMRLEALRSGTQCLRLAAELTGGVGAQEHLKGTDIHREYIQYETLGASGWQFARGPLKRAATQATANGLEPRPCCRASCCAGPQKLQDCFRCSLCMSSPGCGREEWPACVGGEVAVMSAVVCGRRLQERWVSAQLGIQRHAPSQVL